jgi:nucleoid DNA-binding protein
VPFSPLISKKNKRNTTPWGLTIQDVAERLREQPIVSKKQAPRVTESLRALTKTSLESSRYILVSGFGTSCLSKKVNEK